MILSFFVNCSFQQKGIFADDSQLIKNFKNEMNLEPELFTETETYGYNNIICLDKYVILSAVDGKDYLFYVYNYEGDSIGAFGQKGQGPNDLINRVYCGQFYFDSISSFMWINDVSKIRLCAIDINRSLLSRDCYIERTLKTIPMAVNCFSLNDSLLIAEQRANNNYNLLIKNLNSDSILINSPVYKYPVEDEFSIYQSKWRIKPDGTKYVIVMLSISQINIGSLKTEHKVSLNIYSKIPPLGSIIDKESGIAKMIYYCGVDVSDNYIYGLYMNQPHEDTFEKEKSMEIHVLSWEGDAICKFNIPQYITHFAVNETENCILGWDYLNEKLYKYTFDKNIFR